MMQVTGDRVSGLYRQDCDSRKLFVVQHEHERCRSSDLDNAFVCLLSHTETVYRLSKSSLQIPNAFADMPAKSDAESQSL